MQVEQIPTSQLIPYARNSRTHSDEQVAQIVASIREFGFCNPVLVDGDNGIIAGHGRVMAASRMKLDAVPCVRLSHLSESQKRAYVVADNRIALNSSWDDEMLSLEIQELHTDGFDVGQLGFDVNELTSLVGLPEDYEVQLPTLRETTSHTVVVRYYPEDITGMCAWLGVESLPEKLGVAIREKILASTCD